MGRKGQGFCYIAKQSVLFFHSVLFYHIADAGPSCKWVEGIVTPSGGPCCNFILTCAMADQGEDNGKKNF